MNIPNPYAVVGLFEQMLADYAGSKYAVCVESCSAAILLSLFWQKEKTGSLGEITIPGHTYPSAPCSIIHAGGKVKFSNDEWSGIYYFKPYPIVDGALRFTKGMYEKGTLHTISFHLKKRLCLGRGGAILTDDVEAYEWLKRARFDGRNPVPLAKDNFTQLGFNVYMQPADAARGIQYLQVLMSRYPEGMEDLSVEEQKYQDLSKFSVYQQ